MKRAATSDRRATRISMANCTGKQVRAVILILALLFPVVAPVPAWAYDLDLPPALSVASENRAPSTPLSATLSNLWAAGVTNLVSTFATFLSGSSVASKTERRGHYSPEAAARRVKSIKTQLQPESRVHVGGVLSLSALPLDAKGEIIDGLVPKWKSSNRGIIALSDNSEAIAQRPGEAVLTVELGRAKTEFKVTVEANQQGANSSAAPPPPPTDEMIINSLFSAQNNIGKPFGQVEAEARSVTAALRTVERVGSANYSFSVPFASLPGRGGLDASLGVTYNSRLWTKVTRTAPQPNDYYYNVDRNWNLAPGFMFGYGHLDNFVAGGSTPANFTYRFSLAGPDGTRTELSLKQNLSGLRIYESTDGSFIQMETWQGGEANAATLQLRYPDGTVVTYGHRTPDYWQNHGHQGRRYPIKITDRNGNFLSITYLQNDTYGRIDTITDTLGRTIKVEYNASSIPVAITVPPLVEGQPRRQVVRFYYEVLYFENGNRFSDGGWHYPGWETPAAMVLRYLYFPGTTAGFRFDYSSAWGVIQKIVNLRGMTVSTTALDNTGYVTNEGTTAASTTYNYPLTLNDPSQPAPLADVPKFTTRTDQWLPDNTPRVTEFSVFNSPTNSHKISRIKTPDNVVSESWAAITTDWQNGLITDTYIKTLGQLSDFEWSHTKMHWQNQSGSSGRANPRVVKVEHTNDAGQMKPTTFEYDSYNNPTVVREFDYGVTNPQPDGELRKTQTTYVTATQWTSRNLFSLPLIVKRWTNGVLSSRTEYQYDAAPMEDYDDEFIVGFEPSFNPNSPPGEQCYEQCPQTQQCEPPPEWPQFCPCPPETICYPTQIYDATTAYRGNVTKVTAWANPSDDEDPDRSINNLEYDITGNLIKSTMSCCEIKTIQYDDDYHYAYPTRQIRGSSGLQLTREADYNFRTGSVTKRRDENSQETDYTYDAATTRRIRIDFANDGWVTEEFNDTTFPYHVKMTASLDPTKTVSSWTFFNGSGQRFRERLLNSNGYLSTDIEFDEVGRVRRTYNPYTVSGLTDARPSGIKFTEATSTDALGRVLETTHADETTTEFEYNNSVTTPSGFNKTFVVTTDQAGKQRRQLFDVFGRSVRVDEPDSNGVLGAVSSPNQPSHYEYDGNGNLTKITQSGHGATQERLFKYDALSRLTHERQVEANATLNDSGVKVPSGGLWTGFYKYTADGLLDFGVDARGVKTDLTYDALNRVTKVEFFNEPGYTTPTITYFYSETESGFSNIGRLTKVHTEENSAQGTPATEHNYDYDSVGQVTKHIQKITSGSDVKTYQLGYGYNYAGQLVSQTYPSGRVITNTLDNFGALQAVADAQRTYLSGVTINGQGLVSQMNLGNGNTETFSFNDRQQMTSQSLLKGAGVLQKYDYFYGEVNTSTGSVDVTKNNGQLGKIEAWIGTDKQWSQRFGYDQLGRLKEAREHRGDNDSLTYKQIFDYDRFGNLYRKSSSNPTAGQSNPLPYTPIEDADMNKAKNQLATGTTYDDAGQVTQDNKFRTLGFSYDANGRVVKVTQTGTPDAHTVYDGLGNRVATKVNGAWEYIIYDTSGKLVAEYGFADEGSGGVNYLQEDWQGSVRSVTNSNGYIVSRIDYQAFGGAISAGTGLRSTGQGYRLDKSIRHSYATTEEDPSSGLQHTWFRKLETYAGRWSSADPYIGAMSIADPQTFNKYAYVRGDPVNYIDPTGLMMQICGLIDGEPVCISFGGASFPYYGAENGYQAANAMAGGFFGGPVRGYLEGHRAGVMYLENDQAVYAYYINFYASFDGYFGSGVRGRLDEEAENEENNNGCNQAAKRQLRDETIRQEREILREEFGMNNVSDWLESIAGGAICLGALALAAAGKGKGAMAAAKTCAKAIGATLGYKFIAATARIVALNLRRFAKEWEMGCGEMGVIKDWIS